MEENTLEGLYDLLQRIKDHMGFDEEVKLVVKSYKTRIAFVYLNKNTIYLNKNILGNEKLLREALWHELMHLKLKTRWHTQEFFEVPEFEF